MIDVRPDEERWSHLDCDYYQAFSQDNSGVRCCFDLLDADTAKEWNYRKNEMKDFCEPCAIELTRIKTQEPLYYEILEKIEKGEL